MDYNQQTLNTNTTLIHWNTNGLITNYQEFKHTLNTLSPTIICIQETHLIPSDPYTFNIPPYTLTRHDHPSGTRRGGLAILTKNNIPFRHTTPPNTPDIQTLEIYMDDMTLTIINCYFPPNDTDFHTQLNKLDDILSTTTTPIILCGDFNCHHPLWDRHHRRHRRGRLLHDMIQNHSLICMNTGSITLPARFLAHQNTTPDITFASPQIALKSHWSTIDDTYFSDHLPIKVILNHSTPSRPSGTRWNLKHASWQHYTEDMDISAQHTTDIKHLTQTIIDTAHRHIPTTQPDTTKHKAVPWWNQQCADAISERKRALNRHQRYKIQQTRNEYSRAKAQCRRTILQAKRESWSCFINQFNRFTPLHKIWDLTKAFNNRKTPLTKAITLTINGNNITDIQDIANTFATQYLSRSSTLPNPIPLAITTQRDNDTINMPITLQELNKAIQHGGNTSVGPDNIHYTFLKHLGTIARQQLLESFNLAWTTHDYPNEWFHAYICPIPKPHKDTTEPDNYRPISLTSCVHKTFERIIKNRLTHYLATRRILSPIHSGFLPGRSTTDNLARLTADIQNGFADKACTVALFLDIKQAYDTLNITTLLTDLRQIGLDGHILAYLNTYLTSHTFQVKHHNTLSETKFPSTGIMQGSVLSPLLFTIAINSHLKVTNTKVKIATYADDIAIWATHKHAQNALALLQNTINTIHNQLIPLNLEISPQKTQCIAFGRYDTTQMTPLTLHNHTIPFQKTATFLGITFDQHFTFKHHIDNITTRATKRTNILRALTSTEWGGDRATLTKLYEHIIRPILEYGSITFQNAAPTHLHKLDKIQNICLRTITGAFRTSPTTSLHVYNNTTPLHYRRTQQLFRYFFKIQLIPRHPCVYIITQKSQDKYTGHNRSRLKVTLGGRLKQLSNTYDIQVPTQMPPPPLPAFWANELPATYHLISQTKHSLTQTEIQQHFIQFTQEHNHDNIIFTDGSKHEYTTAAAAVLYKGQQQPQTTLKARLPDHTTIYTAELFAIYTAYMTIHEHELTNTIIATDSKAAITAIENIDTTPTHPIIHLILRSHSELQPVQQPILLWLPGHCGIPGNTLVDAEAKLALSHRRSIKIPLAKPDFFPTIQRQLHKHWQTQWTDTPTQLQHIHPNIEKWISINMNSRTHEKAFTRMRIGHSYITHRHLLSGEPRPECTHCQSPLTIKHLLLNCSLYNHHRQPLTHYCQTHNIPFTLPNILGDAHHDLITLTLTYIRETGLINDL